MPLCESSSEIIMSNINTNSLLEEEEEEFLCLQVMILLCSKGIKCIRTIAKGIKHLQLCEDFDI